MNSAPIVFTLALALSMPALACDEYKHAPTPPTPPLAVAFTPSVYTISPGMLAFDGNVIEVENGDGSNSSVTIMSNDNGKEIEIRIVNDNVTAKVNGKDIPADRIKRDDNSVTLLDEHGEVLYKSNIRFGMSEGFEGAFAFSDDWDDSLHAYNDWFALADEEAAAASLPNVMLGVHMDSTGPALEKHLQLEAGATTIINGVYEGLPASAAGIEPYDIIVTINGAETADPKSVREVLRSKEPGDVLEMDVIRAGKRTHVSVTLEKYDMKKMNGAKLLGMSNPLAPGLPGGVDRLFFSRGEGPGSGVGVFVAPERLDRLRSGSVAAAEALREKAIAQALAPQLHNEELRAQLEQLRAQMDEMRIMMQKMAEEAAAAGRSRTPGKNES